MRARASWCTIPVVWLLPWVAWAQQLPANPAAPPVTQTPSPTPEQAPTTSPLGPASGYLGHGVREIRFTGIAEREKEHLRRLLPQKVGEPLDRDLVHDSVKILFNTGLFADIKVEAEKAEADQVILTFAMVSNYFIGAISVEGEPGRPSANQIISATKFQLGEVYSPEKLERARKSILQLMSDNGFYRATLSFEEHPHPETDQMDVIFRITAGAPAQVGQIEIMGDSGYSRGQIEDIAKMHSGDRVTSDRVSNALQRIRKKYLKQKRLLAQVSVANRIYLTESNKVDYTFLIDPGPSVDIAVEGFKIRQSVLRKKVPVYEETLWTTTC